MNEIETSINAPCPKSINEINFIDATVQWIAGGSEGGECFFPCWIYTCGAIVDGELYYCQEYIRADMWSPESGFTDKEFEKELMQDVYSAFRCKLKKEEEVNK